MGILRLGVVVAIGIAILPSDAKKQAELYDRAASAARWTVTFCDRNGVACEQAGALWQQFLAKAEFGAKMAYDAMREQKKADQLAAEDSGSGSQRGIVTGTLSTGTLSTGTLSKSDLEPAWRAKKK